MNYIKKNWEYIILWFLGLYLGVYKIIEWLYLTGSMDRFIQTLDNSNTKTAIENVLIWFYSIFAWPGSVIITLIGYVLIVIGCIYIALSIFMFFNSKIVSYIFLPLLIFTTYLQVIKSLEEFIYMDWVQIILLSLWYISYISLMFFRKKKETKNIEL